MDPQPDRSKPDPDADDADVLDAVIGKKLLQVMLHNGHHHTQYPEIADTASTINPMVTRSDWTLVITLTMP